ncbi:hypothetical protein L1987_60185 [Smallanthus sonchifolius]|uniref:Uncharacterized protein n=1 Tax=Smallanthus sonchifolius TaxID=185202 RepID=A0ACB9D7L0_9ASTR|nr:hypothetical protein L1987_60185 [Smallanthus sonchifolius]
MMLDAPKDVCRLNPKSGASSHPFLFSSSLTEAPPRLTRGNIISLPDNPKLRRALLYRRAFPLLLTPSFGLFEGDLISQYPCLGVLTSESCTVPLL